MRPKIALVTHSLENGGGVAAVAYFLMETIINSGRFDLKIISLETTAQDSSNLEILKPSTWLRGAITTQRTCEGVSFTQVGAIASEFEFCRYLPRKILAETLGDCDIIQIISGFPAWANSVFDLGKPVSVHFATRAVLERRRRDANPKSLKDIWQKSMTKITHRLDNRALRKADAIQAMNPDALSYAKEINHDRNIPINLAPPGIDSNIFKPLDERSFQKDPYILCVGRLSDTRKNLNLLLEAFALTSKELQQTVRLVFAGSSTPSDKFWKVADKLGIRERISIVKRPDQDALVRLYQDATLFALPSDEEGFGVVILEAMACGIPVISTRSGGPDGIITDAVDGFLVPLNDPIALANKLTLICNDSRLNFKIGKNGRLTVEERFATKVAGNIFCEIWAKLSKTKSSFYQ